MRRAIALSGRLYFLTGIAALVLGVAHVLWYLRAFFLAGSFQSRLNVAIFFRWTIALS
jgi:hypothetical protein